VLPSLVSIKDNNRVAEAANADFVERDTTVVPVVLNIFHSGVLTAIDTA
jgi:hypothetical protein